MHPLGIDSAFSPCRSAGRAAGSSSLMDLAPGNLPPSSGDFQSPFANINPVVEEGGLLMTRHPLHLGGSEASSGTEDRRPTSRTNMLPLLLLLRKFPGVGSCEQEQG